MFQFSQRQQLCDWNEQIIACHDQDDSLYQYCTAGEEIIGAVLLAV